MDGIAGHVLPRVLHLLGVVVWIGGVGFVAVVLLPLLRRWGDSAAALEFFLRVVRRFLWWARAAVLVVGFSGLHLLVLLDAWGRFAEARMWWMYAMIAVWLIFALILFVVQPLAARRGEGRVAVPNPAAALNAAQRVHWVLLALSLLTVAGAAAGAHGWFWL